MHTIKRRYDPILLATLNMLGSASLMGFLYCMIVFLHGTFAMETTDIALYMVWFAISWLSVSVMKKGDIWGAYALGIATLAVTFYDLANGLGTIGGALLGTIVMSIVIWYIRVTTPHDHGLDTMLTN